MTTTMLPASEQETLIEDEVISGDSGGEVDGEEDREEVAAAVVTVPGSNLRSKKRSMTNARNEASESLVQSQFPLSRVKKIIKADRDVNLEMFVAYLGQQLSQLCDRSRRKTVLYKDVAHVVRADSRLNFLELVVPQVIPLRQVLIETEEASAKRNIILPVSSMPASEDLPESVDMQQHHHDNNMAYQMQATTLASSHHDGYEHVSFSQEMDQQQMQQMHQQHQMHHLEQMHHHHQQPQYHHYQPNQPIQQLQPPPPPPTPQMYHPHIQQDHVEYYPQQQQQQQYYHPNPPHQHY